MVVPATRNTCRRTIGRKPALDGTASRMRKQDQGECMKNSHCRDGILEKFPQGLSVSRPARTRECPASSHHSALQVGPRDGFILHQPVESTQDKGSQLVEHSLQGEGREISHAFLETTSTVQKRDEGALGPLFFLQALFDTRVQKSEI